MKGILPVLGWLFGLLFLARQPVWALALFDISGGRSSGTTSVSCTKKRCCEATNSPKCPTVLISGVHPTKSDFDYSKVVKWHQRGKKTRYLLARRTKVELGTPSHHMVFLRWLSSAKSSPEYADMAFFTNRIHTALVFK